MIAREQLIETARGVFRSYGFTPIDTPALEYSEILLGKGSDETDKQMFRFTDPGNRDVAMRFDLTIPFARFTAQHLHELALPFKRYHIGTVWRAEKPQKGRYREFMQCDFDTIGSNANGADIEVLLVIHDLLESIGFSKFTVRVNNRLVLNGLLDKLGLVDSSVGILRCLDKLSKVGHDNVVKEMTEVVGTTTEQAESVLKLAALEGTSDQILAELKTMLSGNEAGEAGVEKLSELFGSATAAGIPNDRIALDLSIARGLDYYTGTIYETFLGDLPKIGSVCSGGRYDNLAGLFTSQVLPGVGASLGLDRLLAAMDELEMIDSGSTPAPVLVTVFDARRHADYLSVGRQLRQAGIGTEVLIEPKQMAKQLKYANRKGFRIALIAGEDEFEKGTWQLKNLESGEQIEVPADGLLEKVQEVLGV